MRLLLFVLLFAVACKDDAPTTDDSEIGVLPDNDGDGFPTEEDCDDNDAAVNPDAEELCDGADNDCDGAIDDDATDASAWYTDADADGYGADGGLVQSCAQPSGTSAAGGDCDDADAAIHPNAPETDCADPIDYNCDGSTGYADADADGFAACQECDDGDAAIFPGAAEVCDGEDDNCDGQIDEGVTTTYWQDQDGDGHGDPNFSVQDCSPPTGYATSGDDCDDGDGAVNPSAVEVCNGLDDDCDAATDDADDSLDPSSATAWYADSDGDGAGDANSPTWACAAPSGHVADASDCDDSDGAVHPNATEVCDGVDNNCDGTADEDSAADASTWYLDADNDGYGDAAYPYNACARPSGYRGNARDCDDADGAVHPAATEICNGLDDDCDQATDDADASLDLSTGSTWYDDVDGDGYGDAAAPVSGCLQPSNTVADASDCDDASGAVNPSQTEICNGVDDDCDSAVDDPAALLGSDAACGAVNCNEILATRTSAPDGEYWVDFGGGSMEVFCDMSTSGGGWTVIHPTLLGTLGSLDSMRDEMDRAMVYLRDYSGNRYYTEVEQLPAFAAYDVDVSDTSSVATRITFIPRSVASVYGQTQGLRSNGTDITFTNCDANPNSYIEFWQTGSSYVWNQDYGVSLSWRNTKISTSVPVPDDYFAYTAVHFGGCGTHSTSGFWTYYDSMRDSALAVR